MRWALTSPCRRPGSIPARWSASLTPFWVLYALHDALVKPMPGTPDGPEPGGVLDGERGRAGLRIQAARGPEVPQRRPLHRRGREVQLPPRQGRKLLQEKVKEVVVVDPHQVRFVLHEPWPDFMTFYGTLATGAGWIVPKKYMEQVGVGRLQEAPGRAGALQVREPSRPGVELVMEAYEGYWRKMPSVKRIVFKSVPEATTRLAMLKRGEVDLAYLLDVPQAEDVKRDPNLKLAFSGGIGTFYLDFLDSGTRSRPGTTGACGWPRAWPSTARRSTRRRRSGASRPTGNFVPRTFEFALPIEPYPYDPAKAKQLLAEAGYPNGFDAGDLHPLPPYFSRARRSPATSARSGSRCECAPMERAAFSRALARRSSRASASAQRASTATPPRACPSRAERRRLCLWRLPRPRRPLQAAGSRDRPEEARGQLHQIQQLIHERVRFGPSSTTSGRAASGRAWRSLRSC